MRREQIIYLMRYRFFIMIVLIGSLFSTMVSCTKFYKGRNCIIEETFIYDKNDLFSECHASTLVETASGDIMVAFFAGSVEGSPDNCIWLSKKLRNGKWERPRRVSSGKRNSIEYPCWNPVLFQVPGGELLLCYKIGKNVPSWKGALIRSSDGGETWSEPEILPDGFFGPTKNKPIVVGDRIIYGSSTEGARWSVHMEFSDLSARKWSKTSDINISMSQNLIQPALFYLGGNVVYAVFRSKSVTGPIFRSVSYDGGMTWGVPEPIKLPSNNSGLDGVTTADGKMLLAFNNAGLFGRRSPLSLFYSYDGLKWKPYLSIVGGFGEFSYPSLIQDCHGNIHLTYTYKRKKIKYLVIDNTDS